MQVNRAMFGAFSKNDAIPFDGQMLMNGAYAIFSEHTSAAAFAGYAFLGSTITDSGTELDLMTIAAGDTLLVEGSTTAANDGYKIVDTVAAGVITLTTAFDTDEAFLATTFAHFGRQ